MVTEQQERQQQAERARNLSRTLADQVRVRWLRDTPHEGVSIGGRVYTGRGPVTQRRPQHAAGGHPFQTEPAEVELEPGEVTTMPRHDAELLAVATQGQGAYVEVLGPADDPEAEAEEV